MTRMYEGVYVGLIAAAIFSVIAMYVFVKEWVGPETRRAIDMFEAGVYLLARCARLVLWCLGETH